MESELLRYLQTPEFLGTLTWFILGFVLIYFTLPKIQNWIRQEQKDDKKTKGYYVSTWIAGGSYAIIIFYLVVDFSLLSLLGCGIALACASKCVDFARRVKKSVNKAYVIGLLFGLLGLLGYWIYYKLHSPVKKQSEADDNYHFTLNWLVY